MRFQRPLLLGLGANIAGAWGSPRTTLARAMAELAAGGVAIIARSRLYSTPPVGGGRQARYLNAVVVARTQLAPAALLRLAKRIERGAGRRLGRYRGPRPLDIDILDHGGRIVGRASRRRARGVLVLPHPEMHRRAFVLVPAAEAAPTWRHPLLGVRAATLLARLPGGARIGIRPET
jgi:2-amino-4-hydroxy-6-hydroxymethyldihydropteridine diphosphokinase